MWVLQFFSENSVTSGSRGRISYLPTALALLPAGSTTCGRGSQALGSAHARGGSAFASRPLGIRAGVSAWMWTPRSCVSERLSAWGGAHFAGPWLSTRGPLLRCGHSGPTLGAGQETPGSVLPSYCGSPQTSGFSFWHLAIFSFEFHYGLKTTVCLQPKWGPPVPAWAATEPRSAAQGALPSGCLCSAHPDGGEATAPQPREGELLLPGWSSVARLPFKHAVPRACYATILSLTSSGFSSVTSTA